MTTGRFGEYLVQQGKLTAGQLAQALERQVIFGGRLGTNLVELGFISDLELTRALSRHLGMTPAQPDVFDNVPAELIGLLPRELACRHSAVPFRKEGRALCVAMADPSELAALDELTFAVGCPVKPFLAPEAKIQWALEKYYELTQPQRYVSLVAPVDGKSLFTRMGDADWEAMEQTLPTIENFEHGLKQAYEALLHVRHRDDVVAVLLREFYRAVDRALFFAVTDGRAIGLMGRGGGSSGQFLGLEIPLEHSPLLRQAVDKREPAVQPFSSDVLGSALVALLDGRHPGQVAAFPLVAVGRPIGVLYADDRQSTGPFPYLDLFGKLMAKGGMAVEMLVLRKKILEL